MAIQQKLEQIGIVAFVAFAFVGADPSLAGAQNRNRGEPQIERSTERLPLDEGGQLDLSNISGDITVSGGTGREVVLNITKRAGRRNNDTELSAVQVDIDARSNRIEVRTRYPRNNRRTRISVSYEVTVPRDARVALRSVSGDIVLSNVDGEARVETVSGEVEVRRAGQLTLAKSVSGDVDISDITGDTSLTVSTVNGDLEADDVSGRRLELQTVSGDIEASGMTFGRTDVETVSGDVEYDGALEADGRYSFSAHSGDVRLLLTEDVGFELEASSFSGSVRSDLPVVLGGLNSTGNGRNQGRNVVGTFGDGGALLEVSTFSGDIVISRR
jgi:DUF4097 and DUF4098 domain-containing protein YvlB